MTIMWRQYCNGVAMAISIISVILIIIAVMWQYRSSSNVVVSAAERRKEGVIEGVGSVTAIVTSMKSNNGNGS